jgi:release factor glutamine methyltransferase
MTLAEALHAAQHRLDEAGIENAALEAEVLLRHALGLQRHQLFARIHDDIDEPSLLAFHRLVERRLAHEPTAYIVGHKEFYGIDLETTPDALIPRPETELLVEEALRLALDGPFTIADVGTGCGAIAVALATHLPRATMYAIDDSERALALAARNVERLGLTERLPAGRHGVLLLHGDLLDPLPEPVDLIVANLPYVKTADWEALPPEIREHEPRAALDAGPKGTEALERLLRAAPSHLKSAGSLLAEIGWDEGERLLEVARERFPGANVAVKKDLAGLDRLLIVAA